MIKKIAALTLVELVVVMTIVGLLALIGVPSYKTYLIESRRIDAHNAIRENQILIENYMQLNGVTPTTGQISVVTPSAEGFYDIVYTRVSDSRYKIVATAVSSKSQNNDTGCTVLTLISEMDFVYPLYCK